MTPVFGEFLGPAGSHISAAVAFRDELPDAAKYGAIRQLDRLAATLARYLGDLDLPDEFDPTSKLQPDLDVRAALDARIALRRAASGLRRTAIAVQDAAADDAHPAVRHLRAAADYLTAGRDLLQTHFASEPGDEQPRNSSWAPLLASGPLTAALLTELAAHARQLAPWAARLSVTGPMSSGECITLHVASRWMWIAGASVESAPLQQPPPASARQLLDSVPANVPPARRPPDGPEPVTELCEGITITSERLRHAAVAFAGHARWSPAAHSGSWRRDALASAITGHCSEFILRTLAMRAAQLGIDPAIQARLASAADAMAKVWPAWRAVAHRWDIVSTGTYPGAGISPVAAEFGDLALRLGRLAYRNPQWTPAGRETSLVRLPADLAAAPEDISSVLTAVHHAADATSRIATEDREAVRATAFDDRLYVPTRMMPEKWDMPYRYSPAPDTLVDELLITYDTAIKADKHAVAILDDLATAIGTPSQILGVARGVSASQPASPRHTSGKPAEQSEATEQPGTLPQPGPLGRVLHDLQISEPRALLRAAAIDKAAHELTTEARAQSQRRTAARDIPSPHNRAGTLRQPANTAVPAVPAVPATTPQTRPLKPPRQAAKHGP
jgi:hypothetical protein